VETEVGPPTLVQVLLHILNFLAEGFCYCECLITVLRLDFNTVSKSRPPPPAPKHCSRSALAQATCSGNQSDVSPSVKLYRFMEKNTKIQKYKNTKIHKCLTQYIISRSDLCSFSISFDPAPPSRSNSLTTTPSEGHACASRRWNVSNSRSGTGGEGSLRQLIIGLW
jgi:hypothetical protein